MLRIHAYTDESNFKDFQKGKPFTAWAKSSPDKPYHAFIHVEFVVSDIIEVDYMNFTYCVMGRD